MGGFPEIEDDLDQSEFLEGLSELTSIYDYGTIVNTVIKNREGVSPVGLFTVQVEDHRAYPHVRWFPWASARNRIEATIPFLRSLDKDYTTVIHSEEKNIPFFAHLCKYGILKRCGTIHEFFDDGGKTAIYQTRKI